MISYSSKESVVVVEGKCKCNRAMRIGLIAVRAFPFPFYCINRGLDLSIGGYTTKFTYIHNNSFMLREPSVQGRCKHWERVCLHMCQSPNCITNNDKCAYLSIKYHFCKLVSHPPKCPLSHSPFSGNTALSENNRKRYFNVSLCKF